MPEPFDPLDSMLERLGRRTPPLPAPLAAEVWRRISLSHAVKEGWRERLHAAFSRPSFAVTFVTACVFLGLFLAEIRRSERQNEYNRELMQSYLRLVDPLLEAADRATFAQTDTKS